MRDQPVIAVHQTELKDYGCPYCGYRSGHPLISNSRSTLWVCGECEKKYISLPDGVKQSVIGVDSAYPALQEHPRKGTPARGAEDKKPTDGGEFFHSRGIGRDSTPGCFICGGEEGLRHNIAAFVQCKTAGERIVAMFKFGADLDYREYEPDRVQVKIGCCDDHLQQLQWLQELTRDKDGVITDNIIKEAAAFQ